ncbi:MAG: NUDIX domain-containing protein, partial [Anaerolineales bacterium]
VKLLLVREGAILLVRHSYKPGWHLPGGGVKKGETLEQAARREAREELGAALNELWLVGIYTDFSQYKSDHMALFASRSFTLSGKSDNEIEQALFFKPEALPNDVAPPSRRRIEDYVAGKRLSFGAW